MTFDSISVRENALTCKLRIQPWEDLPSDKNAASSAPALAISVDFPLVGRYFPQWSSVTLPRDETDTGDPAPVAEEIQELAVPYWCPLTIAAAAVSASAVSLRRALRRLEFARIGRCAGCGHELGPGPDLCPECGIPVAVA